MRRRALRNERGQAMVEFALLLPLLLLIVVGIIQFGVALNYWLDFQKAANQGARWAAVNAYPPCGKTSTNQTPCANGQPTLQTYIAQQRTSNGENPNVRICFPTGTSALGDPVKVTVSQPFQFMQVVPVPGITIGASATMRIEQTPGRYAANGSGTC